VATIDATLKSVCKKIKIEKLYDFQKNRYNDICLQKNYFHDSFFVLSWALPYCLLYFFTFAVEEHKFY